MLRKCLPRCGRGKADFVRNRPFFAATFNITAVSKATINENQHTFLKSVHLLLEEFANVPVRKWANLVVHYVSNLALAKHTSLYSAVHALSKLSLDRPPTLLPNLGC